MNATKFETSIVDPQSAPLVTQSPLTASPPAIVSPSPPVGMDRIAAILEGAIQSGHDPKDLKDFVELYKDLANRQAEGDFHRAFAAFQGACPPIQKRSVAKIATKSGSFGYKYAELDEIARTAGPILRDNGLSYTWDSTVSGSSMCCTCTLRHVAGHHVTATFTVPVDGTTAMSAQQKHAATLTYARRQSLVQVLGITTADPDADGAGGSGSTPTAPPAPPVKTITDEQANSLNDRIIQYGANKARFVSHLRVASLAEIPADRFDFASTELERANPANKKKDETENPA